MLNATKIQEKFQFKPTVLQTREDSNHSEKGFKLLNCQECNEKFLFVSALFIHMKRSHKSAPVKVRKKTQNKKKKSDEEVNESFLCSHCGKAFARRDQIRNHIKRTHQQDGKKDRIGKICPQCPDKTFSSKYVLKVHMATHSSDGMLTCIHCGKLVNKFRMGTHMLIHGDKKFGCKKCGKQFAQPAGLIQHMQFHDSDRKPRPEQDVEKRTCHICSKVLASYMSLYMHRKQIHGEKAIICPICGKSCGSRRVLEEHKMVHTDDRPQRCEICSATFKWERSFVEHMKRAHNVKQKVRPISQILQQ